MKTKLITVLLVGTLGASIAMAQCYRTGGCVLSPEETQELKDDFILLHAAGVSGLVAKEKDKDALESVAQTFGTSSQTLTQEPEWRSINFSKNLSTTAEKPTATQVKAALADIKMKFEELQISDKHPVLLYWNGNDAKTNATAFVKAYSPTTTPIPNQNQFAAPIT